MLRKLYNVLDKHGVKATVITSGLMAELFPKRSWKQREGAWNGYAPLGCNRSPTVYRTKEAERDAILKSVAAIQKATGERPSGYMSRPRPGPFTLELCAELGFKWNSDYCDSDTPYTINVNGARARIARLCAASPQRQ